MILQILKCYTCTKFFYTTKEHGFKSLPANQLETLTRQLKEEGHFTEIIKNRAKKCPQCLKSGRKPKKTLGTRKKIRLISKEAREDWANIVQLVEQG